MHFNIYKHIIVFLFITCVCFFTKADAQLLTYKTISTTDGLPSNEINIVIKDSKGYIWIGTKNGLCKWDSKQLTTYNISDGLPNNEVFFLNEDTKGRIWVSCFSPEFCYFYNGHINNKKNTPLLSKISHYPGSMFTISGNELYCHSTTGQLTKYDLNTGRKNSESTVLSQFSFIQHNGIIGIQVGLKREDFFSRDCKQIIIHNNQASKTALYLYSADSPGMIGFCDFRNNIYGFQYGLDSPFYKTNYADKELRFALYNSGEILEVYKDKIFSKKKGYAMKTNLSNPNRPQVFLINKNLYAKTINGLLFCRQIPVLEYEQATQLNYNAKFIFKHKNEIYILNDVYQIINVNKQKKVNELRNDATNSYNLLQYGHQFYITTSFNVCYFSDPNAIIYKSKNTLYSNFKYINSSRKKNFFFTANGGTYGIHCTNFQNNVSDTLLLDKQKAVYTVFEDSKSRLWYSTPNKVYYTNQYYDGIKNSKEFVLDPASPLFCKSIQEDSKGNIFFTTNGGVFVYDGSKKYKIDQTNLLSDNECNKVVIDTAHNSFWVATKNGVNRINYSKDSNGLKFNVWSKFFASDGLRSDNINDLLLDSNKLYIATDKGVNILADINYRPDTQSIPIYVHLNLVNATAKKAYDTLDKIELKHDQNNLTIGFSALYFLRRDRLKTKAYLYRNNNLISQNEITEDKIDYYSLNDGQYKLVIYAFDQDYRYINGKSAPFEFIINPPYYKTWWFIVGTSLLIIIITVGIALWNINRRKKRALQQAELQAKLNESTLKSLQSQMNPHFVFNSLNTIQSFITEKNEEGAIDYLADFSGLMRKILEQSVNTFISLENEIHFLQHYIKLERTRYKDSFDVNWDINLGEDDLTDIYIPTMLIQPILENAVKHGVSNLTNIKGQIDVTFRLAHASLLEVTIKDNGAPSAKGNFKGNSIAVQTIKDRLNIYTKNKLKGVYTLEILDTGATAKITIPI